MYPARMRFVLGSFLLVACSSSPARPTAAPVPAPAPAAPIVVTPPAVPAATPAVPIVIADDASEAAFRDPDRRKKIEAAFPAIEKQIQSEMQAQGLPGLVFGIVVDGELAYAKGFGVTDVASKRTPDADTVYRIGSISKSFTALALLSLRDDGALQLDDPLAKWIPEAARLVYPSRDARPITLRQLTNHTSGLPRMGSFEFETAPSEDTVVTSLAKTSLESTPGTRWNYSNLGFGLLGIVVAHAAKAPFHDVVASRLWKPLGMTATVWDQADVPAGKLAPAFTPGPNGPAPKPALARLGAVDGAGGIYSSVRDMAKYVAFQLAAYPPRNADDTGPIKRATLREAHSTGVAAGLRPGPAFAASTYGFGWAKMQSCRFDDVVGHNGAIDSYHTNITFSPSRGIGMIVMTNFDRGSPDAILENALATLEKTGAISQREQPASPRLAEAMKRLLAIYHQWDEAAFKAILARPIDPREQAELAGYKQLHGACTTFKIARQESPQAGTFDVTCERGAFQMQVSTDSQGQIDGFIGFSKGVAPSPAFASTAQAVLALQAKWDDKIYKKHLAKGGPADVVKALATQFHARHGDCKLAAPLHEGLDFGYQLACKKEDVEMFLITDPKDPTQVLGVNLRPVRDAPMKCE